jgi:hypothetical protein
MAKKVWEVTKVYTCEYIGCEVAFETEVVYPTDFLLDLPRVISHRCSHAKECNMGDKPNCAYGTNPDHLYFSMFT